MIKCPFCNGGSLFINKNLIVDCIFCSQGGYLHNSDWSEALIYWLGRGYSVSLENGELCFKKDGFPDMTLTDAINQMEIGEVPF